MAYCDHVYAGSSISVVKGARGTVRLHGTCGTLHPRAYKLDRKPRINHFRFREPPDLSMMGSSQSHQAPEVSPASSPFWGATTAKSNFCEEDYAVTQYIGELINSVTNVAYLIYGFYGLIKLRKSGNTDVFRTIPYWGLMSVGMCSAAFHISLKYHTQMMDDLSYSHVFPQRTIL